MRWPDVVNRGPLSIARAGTPGFVGRLARGPRQVSPKQEVLAPLARIAFVYTNRVSLSADLGLASGGVDRSAAGDRRSWVADVKSKGRSRSGSWASCKQRLSSRGAQ